MNVDFCININEHEHINVFEQGLNTDGSIGIVPFGCPSCFGILEGLCHTCSLIFF